MLAYEREPISSCGIFDRLWQSAFGTVLYDYTLKRRVPKKRGNFLITTFPGDAVSGYRFLAGSVIFDGKKYSCDSLLKGSSSIPLNVLNYFDSFGWLSDLCAVKDDKSKSLAVSLIIDWIIRNQSWRKNTWRPEITGTRLVNWVKNFKFLARGDDEYFENLFYSALVKQSVHLHRTFLRTESGASRLAASKGLVFCGIFLPESDNYLISGLDCFEGQLKKLVFPDGGHVSRNPKIQLDTLLDVVEIKLALNSANIRAPAWLETVADRMVPMVKAMRHGDGGLALFNGGSIGDPRQIDFVLENSKKQLKPMKSAIHSGFQRMLSGKTTLIFDTGINNTSVYRDTGICGGLSFEVSFGKERLIVNCGSGDHLGDGWLEALKRPASQSTLSLCQEQSGFEKKLELYKSQKTSTPSRREYDGNTVVEGEHIIELRSSPMDHRRILSMCKGGNVVRGVDRLSGKPGVKFAIRFHLHPNIKVIPIRNFGSALLKTRKGSGWQFTIDEGCLIIEDSVYIEGLSKPRRSKQIVLYSETSSSEKIVKWILEKI